MRKTKSLINNLDWPLFIGFISLIVFGLITIYSVAFNEEFPNIFSFSEKYGKQIMWIGIALFMGIMVFLIDSDRIIGSPLIYICWQKFDPKRRESEYSFKCSQFTGSAGIPPTATNHLLLITN